MLQKLHKKEYGENMKPFRFGPIALTTTLTTNLLNPGTTTGGVNCNAAPYDKLMVVLTHIRVVNKSASNATFSLWLGATGANAAGTEVIGTDFAVAANSAEDFYANLPLYSTDFLVGGASANTALTIQGDGVIGVA